MTPETKGFAAYGEELIYERHRHRYEVNNAYRDRLTEAGLVISGLSPDGRLVEMVELPDHPWFLGNQGTPSSRAGPLARHRSSGTSLAPPWRTRRRAGPMSARAGSDVVDERLLETFLDLVRIDSPSGEEAAFAAYCAGALARVGFSVRLDERPRRPVGHR